MPAHTLFVAAGRPWALRRALRRRRTRRDGATGPASYEVGTAIDFTSGGDGARYLASGWWYQEPHGTWSRGEESRLRLTVRPPVRAPLVLEFQASTLITPRRPQVELEVIANDVPVGRWRFDRSLTTRVLTAALPDGAIAVDGQTELTFVVSDPCTPADARFNSDVRQVGITLHALVIRDPS